MPGCGMENATAVSNMGLLAAEFAAQAQPGCAATRFYLPLPRPGQSENPAHGGRKTEM